MIHLPDNIKPSWFFGLVARLQQASRTQEGFAIIEFKVMVDKNGVPVTWTEPRVTKLEPLHQTVKFLEKIMENM